MTHDRAPIWLHVLGTGLVAGLGWAAYVQSREARPGSVPVSSISRAEAVEYLVDREEWTAGDPTYCEIMRRFALPTEQQVATLQRNGGGSGCADGNARVPRGQSIWIAIEGRPPNACPAQYFCSHGAGGEPSD